MTGSASPAQVCPHRGPLLAYLESLGFEAEERDLRFLEQLLRESCEELKGRGSAVELSILRGRLGKYVEWRLIEDERARHEELERRRDDVVGLVAAFVNRHAHLGCPHELLSEIALRLLVLDPKTLRRDASPEHLGQHLKMVRRERRRQSGKEKIRQKQLRLGFRPPRTTPRDPVDLASEQELLDLTFELARRHRPSGDMFIANALLGISKSEISRAWPFSERAVARRIADFRESLRVFLGSDQL